MYLLDGVIYGTLAFLHMLHLTLKFFKSIVVTPRQFSSNSPVYQQFISAWPASDATLYVQFSGREGEYFLIDLVKVSRITPTAFDRLYGL
jgi:hypothetical protein